MSTMIQAMLYILYRIITVCLQAYFVSLLPLNLVIKIILGVVIIFGWVVNTAVNVSMVTITGKLKKIADKLDAQNLHNL